MSAFTYADMVKRFAAREKVAAERERQAAERKRQEAERERRENQAAAERKRQEKLEMYESLKRARLKARARGHACRYFDAHLEETQEQKINKAVNNVMEEIAHLEHANGPRKYIDNFMDLLEGVSDDDRRQMVVDIITDYAEIDYPKTLKERKEFREMWARMNVWEQHFYRWRNHLWDL